MDTHPISDYKFSVRVLNALGRLEGVKTLEDIAKLEALDLLQLPNFANAALNEVERALAMVGLELAGRAGRQPIPNSVKCPTCGGDISRDDTVVPHKHVEDY